MYNWALDSVGNWHKTAHIPATDEPLCEFIYTSRRYDPDSELYYYRTRYYNPELGRFLSRDPLGYEDGMSLYEYIESNPAKYVDPSGLFKDYECCTNDQKKIIKGDVDISLGQIKKLRKNINAAIAADKGQYPWFTGQKLKGMLRHLKKSEKVIRYSNVKCESLKDSRMCRKGSVAWVKWVFTKTVHLCPRYFGGEFGPKTRSAFLVHEGTHVSGTLDTTYFHGRKNKPDVWPHDWITGWDNIASTYDTLILAGFCIPGYDCKGAINIDPTK